MQFSGQVLCDSAVFLKKSIGTTYTEGKSDRKRWISTIHMPKFRQNSKNCGELGNNGKKSEMAAELLSDGSLKWLALITILLTRRSLIVMEEPENFLYPAMQHHIIELMRETLKSKSDIRLFSTHCETILNLIDPENVILTYFRNGQTQVKRIKNPELLKQAIQETGFGVGSHLITGAFDYGNEF